MTTPLTIYRLGLCGNSANESTRKHHFRTQKHQKVNKSSQKTTPNRFGYWRPGVRISTLRPKRKREPLWFSFSFLPVWVMRTTFLRSKKEFAYPLRRSTSSLVRRSKRISSHSEYLYASIKKREPLWFSFSFLAGVFDSTPFALCAKEYCCSGFN